MIPEIKNTITAQEYDCSHCFVRDKEIREDRQLSRSLEHMTKNITREKNVLRRMIEYHGLEEYFENRQWTDKRYRELDIELKALPLSPSLLKSFLLVHTLLLKLCYLREELKKELKLLAKRERYQRQVEILDSVPGIDVLTAIRLMLEWVNVNRFKRGAMFAHFLGLVPSDYSTGERDHKGHITKHKEIVIFVGGYPGWMGMYQ